MIGAEDNPMSHDDFQPPDTVDYPELLDAEMMRRADAYPRLVAALRFALSAIETPGDLTKDEIGHVIEDCALLLRELGEE